MSVYEIKIFLEKNSWSICKQWRPWSDATFCSVWSGSALLPITLLGVSHIQWVNCFIFIKATARRERDESARKRLQEQYEEEKKEEKEYEEFLLQETERMRLRGFTPRVSRKHFRRALITLLIFCYLLPREKTFVTVGFTACQVPSEMGSTLKGKNWANSFLSEYTPFQKEDKMGVGGGGEGKAGRERGEVTDKSMCTCTS